MTLGFGEGLVVGLGDDDVAGLGGGSGVLVGSGVGVGVGSTEGSGDGSSVGTGSVGSVANTPGSRAVAGDPAAVVDTVPTRAAASAAAPTAVPILCAQSTCLAFLETDGGIRGHHVDAPAVRRSQD